MTDTIRVAFLEWNDYHGIQKLKYRFVLCPERRLKPLWHRHFYRVRNTSTAAPDLCKVAHNTKMPNYVRRLTLEC